MFLVVSRFQTLIFFWVFKVLDLSNNRIEKEAWTYITQAVSQNDTLESLILSGNNLSPEESVLLADARDQNQTLENLVFDGVESMLRHSSSTAELETKVCSFNKDEGQV